MQKFCILSIFVVCAGYLSAQSLNMDLFKNIKPRSIGPAAMSGRITAVDVDLKNDIYYVGAASGGVWQSNNGGINWQPIFDKQSTQSIGSIAVNQNNPSEIWVGTGEGNPRNSQNFGDGIFKSIDGGKNWVNMGLRDSRAINRLAINPLSTETVYAGVIGSAFGPNEQRGVYKTTDGGKTWKKSLYVTDQTGCADLIMDPTNPNKLIAAMWEYGRKPWTFNSGGKNSGMYITYDGGDNWKKVTDADGLPKGDLGRIGLTMCRTKTNVVYAVVEAKENGIYRSDDGGTKWRKVGQNGERPFYYSGIYCDPKNENRLYNIYSNVSKSEDGGKTWTLLMGYTEGNVHPDHHAWWIHPEQPNLMIDGNDGGANITRDYGKSWQFFTNIPVGQFYHVNVDNEIPYNLYGGLQDNGSWVGPSAVWRSGGIRNADWQEVDFGDGFDVMPRRDNTRFVYAMSQGGSVNYIDRKTGSSQYIQPQNPGSAELRYNWNAAMAQDPFTDCGVYYGSQFVHYSGDCGQTWTIISPDLTTNDTFKINGSKHTGGLTPDVTNAENHCTILAIAPSPTDKNVIWASTDDGNLQLTTDGGKTWTNLTPRIIGCPKNAWIPQIEVTKNAGEAFIIVNNYRQNDFKPYAYHTTDYGKTFTSIVSDGQVGSYTLSFTQDAEVNNLWFLGTDFGLYISMDGGKIWSKWTNGYPSVPTMDMKIHPRDGDLVLGTFGRAFWILDDIRFLREIARTKGEVLNQPLKIFAPGDAYNSYRRSFDGERFNGNAIYEGTNKSSDALFTIWSKTTGNQTAVNGGQSGRGNRPPSNVAVSTAVKDSTTPEKKSMLYILSESGDTLRRLKITLDSGMNRVTWGLERKGPKFPNWEDEKKGDEDNESGTGGVVLPGRYKVVVVNNKDKDSTYVNVKYDPRVTISEKELRDKDAAMKDIRALIGKSTDAFNRLKDANKTIGIVESEMDMATGSQDSVKTKLLKQGKSLKDSILVLQKMFMSPRDVKGIVRSSDNLTDKMFHAMGLMSSGIGKPTDNSLMAFSKAKETATKLFDKINTFFIGDWAKYQSNVEAMKYSLFKKYEPLKIESGK